jgi:hypothetical protein
MLWYNLWPSWRLIALPALIAVAFAAAMGAGLWISALNVKYRDFRYIVPFVVRELIKTPDRRDELHPRNSRKKLANRKKNHTKAVIAPQQLVIPGSIGKLVTQQITTFLAYLVAPFKQYKNNKGMKNL